ncbi:unnamed protein product, partial [Didymodactylos carnosus]
LKQVRWNLTIGALADLLSIQDHMRTRAQHYEFERNAEEQLGDELERLGGIEVEESNNPRQQAHTVYRPIQFIMAEKLVNSILSKSLEKLPKFSGTITDDVDKWIIDITHELNLVKLDDSHKLAVIQTYLDGDARR